jgi:hypothetical protein
MVDLRDRHFFEYVPGEVLETVCVTDLRVRLHDIMTAGL